MAAWTAASSASTSDCMTAIRSAWRISAALAEAACSAGETEGAGTNDAQDQHFIAFVSKAGMLYELDGRNIDAETKEAFPFCHGATSAETFLMDAARVIREDFMGWGRRHR